MTIPKPFLFAAGSAVVIGMIVVSGLIWRLQACHDFNEAKLQINDEIFSVAVARGPTDQARGLIGCQSIPEHSGMYFPYATAAVPQFWMRGMSIPIDIVWISDGQVIGIVPSVPPVEKFVVDPPLYRPPRPVTGVLELGAGKAAEYGIVVGQAVTTPR